MSRTSSTIWASQQLSTTMLSAGDTGYIVRTVRSGRETITIQAAAPVTNISRQAVEYGWCGETDGVSVHALGRGRIVRSTRGGERVQVLPLAREAS